MIRQVNNMKKKLMDKMTIIAKTAPDPIQIRSRVRAGATFFEIQLLNREIDIEAILDLVKNVNVVSVHTPIVYYADNYWDELLLTDLNDDIYKEIFFDTCKLADTLATYYGHNIIAIIHCDICLYELQKYELSKIQNTFGEVLKRYRNIQVGLENISPIRDNPLRLNNGWLMGPADIVNYLNGVLEDNKFVTILDICHLEMAQYFLNLYKSSDIFESFPGYQIEDYLDKYNSTLGMIHLNSAEADGYGRKHGHIASINLVKKVLLYFLKKNKSVPYICLEVKETDYKKCVNYQQAYQNINMAIEELENEQFAGLYNSII